MTVNSEFYFSLIKKIREIEQYALPVIALSFDAYKDDFGKVHFINPGTDTKTVTFNVLNGEFLFGRTRDVSAIMAALLIGKGLFAIENPENIKIESFVSPIDFLNIIYPNNDLIESLTQAVPITEVVSVDASSGEVKLEPISVVTV